MSNIQDFFCCIYVLSLYVAAVDIVSGCNVAAVDVVSGCNVAAVDVVSGCNVAAVVPSY